MNTSNTNTITSTDLWLAGCKGQALSSAQQSSNHYAEGSLIRSLFSSRLQAQLEQNEIPTPTDVSEQRHWQYILAQIRLEGMFTSPAIQRPEPGRHFRLGRFTAIASNQRWFALVASVAVLAIGLSLFMQQHDITHDDSAVVMRGDEAAQHMTVQANQTAAQVAGQIEAILIQHQLPYRRTELTNGGVQIQAKVPKDSLAGQMLKTLGLSMPEHERLNVLVLNQ